VANAKFYVIGFFMGESFTIQGSEKLFFEI